MAIESESIIAEAKEKLQETSTPITADALTSAPEMVFEPIDDAVRPVQEEIVKKMIEMIEKESATDETYLNTLRVCEGMYSMDADVRTRKRRHPQCSHVANPLIMITVEQLVAREQDVTLGVPGGPAEVSPGNEKDEKEKRRASIAQKALNDTLETNMDKVKEHGALFRTAFKYGDAWTKTIWADKKEFRSYTKQLYNILTQRDQTVMDWKLVSVDTGPKFITLDTKHVHFPKDFPNPTEAPWIAHEYYYSNEEIEERVATGEFEGNKNLSDSGEKYPRIKGDDIVKDKVLSMQESKGENKYKKIYEVYTKYKPLSDPYPSEWIFIINVTDKTMLRGIRNKWPFRPLMRHTPKPVENKPRGRPYPKILEQLWEYVNTTMDVIIDNMAMANNPGGWVSSRAGLKKKLNVMAPGVLEEMNGDPNNLMKIYDVPDVKPSAYKVLELLETWYEKLTGISDAVLGRYTEGVERPTARGTNDLINQATISFEEMNKNLQSSLAEVYYQILWLMVNVGGDDYFSRYLDEPGIATEFLTELQEKTFSGGLLTEDGSLKYDVRVRGNTLISNKVVQQRLFKDMFDVLMSVPLLKQFPDMQVELIRELIQKYEVRGLENFAEVLKKKVQELLQQPIPQAPTLGAGEPAPAETGTDLAQLGF